MYNMSMLRHRFSNERWRAALNHSPLLFSKTLYYISELEVVLYYSVNMSYVLILREEARGSRSFVYFEYIVNKQ